MTEPAAGLAIPAPADRIEGFPVRPPVLRTSWRPRGDYHAVVNLKSCEMQHPAADALITELLAALTANDVCRYPYHAELMGRLAEIGPCDIDNVLLTAGSCSAIGLIVDGLAAPAGRLLLQEPAFDSWLHYSTLRGVPAARCPGLAGSPPGVTTDALTRAMRTRPPAVVAITNPGNPTGLVLPVEQIADLAELAADYGHLLVVDECYGAFTGTDHASLVATLPNLVVIRSLSKAWALAGARIAVVFGPAELIDYLRRFRSDSPVSAVAVALACAMSRRLDELRAIWADVAAIRDEFGERVLSDHPGWSALRPGGNFVTFVTGTAGAGRRAEEMMSAKGIRIRGLDGVPGLDGALRVSLAAREQMTVVADELAAI